MIYYLGGALQSGEHVDNLLKAGFGGIHTHILLVLGTAHCLEAE